MAKWDYHVSWDAVHGTAIALSQKIWDFGPWERMIAVARGGLVPGAIMAHRLGIRRVDTVCIQSYEGKQRQKAVSQALSIVAHTPDGGKGYIVVDDIADTGDTVKLVRQMLPNAFYVALYAKPAGVDSVDAYITLLGQDTWIHFPWES